VLLRNYRRGRSSARGPRPACAQAARQAAFGYWDSAPARSTASHFFDLLPEAIVFGEKFHSPGPPFFRARARFLVLPDLGSNSVITSTLPARGPLAASVVHSQPARRRRHRSRRSKLHEVGIVVAIAAVAPRRYCHTARHGDHATDGGEKTCRLLGRTRRGNRHAALSR